MYEKDRESVEKMYKALGDQLQFLTEKEAAEVLVTGQSDPKDSATKLEILKKIDVLFKQLAAQYLTKV
jgi:hypothetical protein